MRRLDTMRNILKKAKTNDLTKIKSKALTPLMYDKDKHTFLQLSLHCGRDMDGTQN